MKTQFMLPAALIVGLAGASAQAAFYSNLTPSGSGVVFGGTAAAQAQPAGGTGLLTSMVCDDVTFQPGVPNGSYTLNDFSFTIANFNTITVDTAPTVLFYDPDGPRNPATAPLNGPGTLIGGIVFNLVGQLPANTPYQLSADVSGLGISFPLNANGERTIWVCQVFDDANGTALDQNNANVTVAEYDNLGAGLCDSPTVGSSLDDLFGSDPPPGQQGNFGGAPVANLCLELSQ